MMFFPLMKSLCISRFTVRCVAAGLIVFGAAAPARADDAVPKPFPPGHFDKMAARSPFSPPTAAPVATPPPPPPGPKPFEKYTVTLLMQQGSEYVATLNNKDTSEHTRVRTDEPNLEGIKLVSVDWANEPAQTKVTLSNGTQTGVVGFDPSAAPPAAAPAPVPAGGVRPGQRPAQPANVFHPAPGVAAGGSQPPVMNAARRQAVIRSGITPPPTVPGAPPIGLGQRPVRPPIPGAASVAGGDDDDD